MGGACGCTSKSQFIRKRPTFPLKSFQELQPLQQFYRYLEQTGINYQKLATKIEFRKGFILIGEGQQEKIMKAMESEWEIVGNFVDNKFIWKIKSRNFEYEGQIVDGKPNGLGNIIFLQKNKVVQKYSGQFDEGLRHGKGTYYIKEGQKALTGGWRHNVLDGQGRIRSKNYSFVGQFINNKRNGYGEEYYFNSSRYQGNFYENKRKGFGKVSLYNKIDDYHFIQKYYEGFWKNDEPNGRGKLQQRKIDPKENQEAVLRSSGIFVNGKLYKSQEIDLPESPKRKRIDIFSIGSDLNSECSD